MIHRSNVSNENNWRNTCENTASKFFEPGLSICNKPYLLYKINVNVNIDLNSLAKGYAVERINTAMGDATLFELILAEYKKAPQITKDRYFIETMNAILSDVPNKVIVDTKLENFLPMLNLKNKENR